MEQTVVQHAFELWGPVGAMVAAVMAGGWVALRWLANRDDARNAKMVEMAEKMATVAEGCRAALSNNTAALQENGRAMTETLTRVANMEQTIETYFSLSDRSKSNTRRKNA